MTLAPWNFWISCLTVLTGFSSFLFTVECTSLSTGLWTPERCSDLAFQSNSLLCSSCDKLADFELEAELGQECRSCCKSGDDDKSAKANIKFARAVIEVCECKFGRYPQVAAFVRSSAMNRFPNLSWKHIRGADPIVKLYSEDGSLAQTLGIEKWNTDTIEEFLADKLL